MSKTDLTTPLPKEKIWDLNYIKFLLEASASSAKFGIIKLYEVREQVFNIRGNINVLLVSPFGTGKSAQIFNVQKMKVERATSLSFPGLIGSISRDGQLIIGSCFKAGGTLLILDEAQNIGIETKNAMNALMEWPHFYKRVLGYKINMFVKKRAKGGAAWIKGSENEFEIYSKFSCIASTMHISLQNPIEQAWASRFMLVRMRADRDYMKKLLTGETIYEINPLNVKVKVFTFPEYLKFIEYYFQRFDSSYWADVFSRRENEFGYVARNAGDFVRLAAFTVALNGGTEITFEDVKNVFDKFFDQSMYNIMMGPLSHQEYEILNNMDKTEEDMAALLGMTQQNISRYITNLQKKGLLVKKEEAKIIEKGEPWVPLAKPLE